jgi:hypothetical protein
MSLSEIDKRTTLNHELQKSSRLINEIIRILIEAHYNLINMPSLIEPGKVNEYRTLRAKRCVNLLTIVRSATSREEKDILVLQENAAQILVYSDPLESYHLALLSFAKLELYDHLLESSKENDDEEYMKELLEDSKALLVVATENVTNRVNDQVPSTITEQKWWKRVEASEKALQQQAQSLLLAAKTADKAKPVSGSRRTSVTPAATAKKAAPPPPPPPPPPAKGGKASAGKPGDAKAAAANNQAGGSSDLSSTKYVKKESNFDRKILQTQCSLCSARVFSRLKDFDKAKSFYEQVIKNEPKVSIF